MKYRKIGLLIVISIFCLAITQIAEAVKRFHEITRGRKLKPNELPPKAEEQDAMDFFKGQESVKEEPTTKQIVTEEKVTTVEEPKEEVVKDELEDCGSPHTAHRWCTRCRHRGCQGFLRNSSE